MSWLQALILGIIQGLTEFLPISSTAHLRLAPVLFGWEKDPGSAFTAVIQWGTFVASVVYFRADILRILGAFFRGLITFRPLGTPDARLAWMIAVGTVPIVAAGLLLKEYIKGPFRNLYVVALALIVLALVLTVAEILAMVRARRGETATELETLGWDQALLVGFFQALALIPGASRSGSTITGGLLGGMSRSAAARYSFLLSLPSVFGAGLYELVKEREELLASADQVGQLILATIVSGVVGYGAIAFLMAFLRTRSTAIFIVYRVALGFALLWLLNQGAVQPEM